jgi:hypothetical protein
MHFLKLQIQIVNRLLIDQFTPKRQKQKINHKINNANFHYNFGLNRK